MTLVIAILVTLSGVALAAFGVRGRRFPDDAPRCRRCGYDLRGLASGARCPECGTSLDAPRAIRTGGVERRPRWIALGVTLLLAGGTTVGLDRAGQLNARTLDRLTPTAWLLWRAEHGRGPALTATIWRLLYRQHREPDRVTEAQRQRILARLVAIQGDATLTWDRRWNEVVENAYLNKTLPAGLTRTYVENLALAVSATVEPPTLEVDRRFRPDFAIVESRHRDLGGSTLFGGGVRRPMWTAANLQYRMKFDGETFVDSRRFLPDGDGFIFALARPGKFEPFPSWNRVPRDFAERHRLGACELEIELQFDIVDADRRERGTLGTASRTIRLPVIVAAATATTQSGDD